MLLTIAIPTYNRNDILAGNVARLLPQLTPEVCLVILDNCSDISVSQTLAPLLDEHPKANVQIIRHPNNLGANPNILRCYEVASTPWVWTLGDDDPPHPTAVAVILKAIQDYPEAIYLNFTEAEGELQRSQDKVLIGTEQFLDALEDFGIVLLISLGVFRVQPIREQLHVGYRFCYSCVPHVAALLAAIGSTGVTSLRSEPIIEDYAPDTPMELVPKNVNPCVGIATLLDLSLSDRAREILIRQLAQLTKGGLSLQTFTSHLILSANRKGETALSQHLYRQATSRLFSLRRSASVYAQILIGKVLLRYPSLGERVVAVIYERLKRKPFEADRHASEDRKRS